MTLQEKYDLLMEKIADKTISPGLFFLENGFEKEVVRSGNEVWRLKGMGLEGMMRQIFIDNVKIIGHPITIGRVCQIFEDKDGDVAFFYYGYFIYQKLGEAITKRPKDKLDKPIEPTEEFEPVIDFLLTVC